MGPVLAVCFSQSLRIWSSSQNEQHPRHQLCFLQWEEVPCVVAPWRSVPDHHFKAWGEIGRSTFQRQISHLRFQKSWKERINREGARECFTLSLWPHRYARGGGWTLKSTRFFPSPFPLLFQRDAAHSWWVVQGQPGKPSASVKPCPELLGSLILSDMPVRMYWKNK